MVKLQATTSTALYSIASLRMMQLLQDLLGGIAVLHHRSALGLGLDGGLKLNQMKGSDYVPSGFPHRKIWILQRCTDNLHQVLRVSVIVLDCILQCRKSRQSTHSNLLRRAGPRLRE